MQLTLKNKRYILTALLMCMLAFILSGCREIKPITDSAKVQENYNSITTSLATAQGTVGTSIYVNKKTKAQKIEYSRTSLNTLKAQEASLTKVINSFDGTNHSFGLPKHTYAYAKQAKTYIHHAINTRDPKDLESEYHNVVAEAVTTFNKMPKAQKNKKTERLLATLMAFDTKRAKEIQDQKKNEHSSTVDNSPSLRPEDKNKATNNTTSNNIFYPSNSTGIPFGLGIALIVLSGLIILFIFLQPSKANDAMSALSDTAGHDLLSEAKPDDYTLFLMRGTVILTLIVVGILGYMEFKG